MAYQQFLNTLLCVILWLVISTPSLKANEDEPGKFAQEISEKIFNFYEDLRDKQFYNDQEDSLDHRQSVLNEFMFLSDIVSQARKLDFKKFNNSEFVYALEEILKTTEKLAMNLEIIDSSYEHGKHSSDQNIFYNKECNYEIDYDIWLKTNNTNAIEFYWKSIREATGELAKKNLTLTLNGLRNAANLSDTSPLEFWLGDYNLTEMQIAMNEIQPLYNELHAFIRNGLRKKFGESIIAPDGMIPHHLFEKVLAQTWTNKSTIEELFSYDSLPSTKIVFKDRLNNVDLYEIVDKFYQQLGFNEITYSYMKDHIIMISKSNDCEIDVYHLNHEIHFDVCVKINFEEFLKIYFDVGKLNYAKEMTGLPAYFRFTHDLEYPIGKAVMLSASTHSSLKSVGLISEYNMTEEIDMNRLLRKSIKSLLNAAVDYVHIKLMAELLTGNIEEKDLNYRYWELMDKYVGVEAPRNHKEQPGVIEVDPFFFKDMNSNVQSRNFNSEILSYQMYKKLCGYTKNYPTEPLHLCDFQGTKAAGDILKKMMSLGTSKPFKEVMGVMFPEIQTTSAESLLEYYNPVKQFLVKKNLEANAKPGWKHSDKSLSEESTENKSQECEL